MYSFPLVISCCDNLSNIPSKFVKYNDDPLFKVVTLVLYGAAINWVKNSIEEIEFDGNDLVPSEGHSFRSSMENLRLRDDFKREEYIRGSHPFSLRRQNS